MHHPAWILAQLTALGPMQAVHTDPMMRAQLFLYSFGIPSKW
ncbi:hypothetical protein BSU04_01880 [Caballeronia sordidicola]|uniref:Uncharacterized protein n=1 Tax=Caballeronia sordidicola TaxID=196367 RepID=A0A226XAG3_CABSO|nr:hypothetical protein BSU04_01880 [Caballeronia sordidicola]